MVNKKVGQIVSNRNSNVISNNLLDSVVILYTTEMPGVITVSDFLRETKEDLSSPTTSNFVTHIPQCRETVNKLEEVRNFKF